MKLYESYDLSWEATRAWKHFKTCQNASDTALYDYWTWMTESKTSLPNLKKQCELLPTINDMKISLYNGKFQDYVQVPKNELEGMDVSMYECKENPGYYVHNMLSMFIDAEVVRTLNIVQWLRYKYYNTCSDDALLKCLKLTCYVDYKDDATFIDMLNIKAMLYPLYKNGSYGSFNEPPLRLQCEIRDDEFDKEIELPNGDVCVVHVEKTHLLPGHRDKYFIDMVDEIVKVRFDALRDK